MAGGRLSDSTAGVVQERRTNSPWENFASRVVDFRRIVILYFPAEGFRREVRSSPSAPFPGSTPLGAVSEWFKVQSWKDCVGLYPTESSNLSRSATFY